MKYDAAVHIDTQKKQRRLKSQNIERSLQGS